MGCGSSSTGLAPGGRDYHKHHRGLKPPGYGHTLESTQGGDIRDPDPNDTTTLQVVSANMLIKENTFGHKTNYYDITIGDNPKLVIRRGQCFDVSLTFNRPYNKLDDVRFVFQFETAESCDNERCKQSSTGDKPNPNKGTLVELVVSDKDVPLCWGAKIVHTQDNEIIVRLITPPTLYVGKWRFNADVISKNDDKNVIYRYKHKNPIYILFNPWCKDDQVYLKDEDLLKEYILSDSGKIFTGSKKSINGKNWSFGQFDGVVLDCAMYLLESVSELAPTARHDPIRIARSISAIANSQDDRGVLTGNWSGDYSGGTPPLKWSGSVKILTQYYNTKKPVKYGQCWVFSGVVTTLCRTIGIPARSVTNFSSAHDCDGSITIDKHWNTEGEELDYLDSDSVWNFHVWNDVWMARPDLPEGYGGWQAIDATPQETSEGVYCCGPFPVSAVKKGDVNLPYDGAFIFAEVNADRIHWIVQGSQKPNKQSKIETDKVGKYISTNAPECKGMQSIVFGVCFDTDREDVTKEYKHEEGSKAERKSVITANLKGSSREGIYDVKQVEDVKFELLLPEKIIYGEAFDMTLKATNESKENRTMSNCIKTYSTHYTGVKYKDIKKDRQSNVVIPPGESKEFKVAVSFLEYDDKLTDDCHLNASCMAQIEETNQVYNEQEAFQLTKPVPEIKGPEEGKVNESFEVTFSFKNPLPKPLTNCELVIEGPGLPEPKIIKQDNVPEGGEFRTSFQLTPAKEGSRRVMATFHSKQLESVGGSYRMIIAEA